MDENTFGKVAEKILGKKPVKKVEPVFKVEKIGGVQKKKTDDSTEGEKKEQENLHPFLGGKIDIKV